MKISVVIFVALVLVFSSCNFKSDNNKQTCTISITDSYQRTVSLKAVPQRIISASPAITEIIFAMGEGKRLVGRTLYCKYPAETANIPSIGGLEDPSLETIVKLNPELVIASTHFKKEMVQQLETLKIPVIVEKNQDSFDGVYSLINKIASILKVDSKGDSVICGMQKKVEYVKTSCKNIKYQPSVYFVIGFGKTGDFTAGGNTFISEMISMAGGINIASDVQGWSYSLEKLIEKDPDIILIRPGDKALFCNTTSYQKLKAVKQGKVFEVNNDLFELTGPRLADGLELLFHTIHPEAYNQVSKN